MLTWNCNIQVGQETLYGILENGFSIQTTQVSEDVVIQVLLVSYQYPFIPLFFEARVYNLSTDACYVILFEAIFLFLFSSANYQENRGIAKLYCSLVSHSQWT